YGKDKNPWCLLQGDGEGNLTEKSWEKWNEYRGIPKQVAFKDGELLAFRGWSRPIDPEDEYVDDGHIPAARTWWDSQDSNFVGIPVRVKLGDGRRGVKEYNPRSGEWGRVTNIERGDRKNGVYETWYNEDQISSRGEWKNKKEVGTHRHWDVDGSLVSELVYHDDGTNTIRLYENGVLVEESTNDNKTGRYIGEHKRWFNDGKPWSYSKVDERGNTVSAWQRNRQGDLIYEVKRTEVGYTTSDWYDSGVLKSVVHRDADGSLHGERVNYYEDGSVHRRSEWSHDAYVSSESYFENGNLSGRAEEMGGFTFEESWIGEEGGYDYLRTFRGKTRRWHVGADGVAREIVDGEPTGEPVRGVERGKERDMLDPEDWNGGLLFRTLERDERVKVDEVSEGVFEVGVDPDWSVVADRELIEKLESGPKRKAYAAMLLIDGKLYPPMSSQESKGQLRNPSELGRWEESEERPDKVKKFKAGKNGERQGVFELLKDNGKSVPAAYNPYFHQSDWALNDQFSSAWDRPKLVVVEVEIPESEMSGEYKAKYAKDATGLADWKDGGLTKKVGGREVYLSRWRKPVRVLSDAEVADLVAPRLLEHGVGVPFNVVTPGLRYALVAKGVEIVEPEKGAAGNASRGAWEEYLQKQEQKLDVDGYRDMVELLFERPQEAKAQHNGTYWNIAYAPDILSGCGFADGVFEVPFKTIKSHMGKVDHLSKEDWKRLPEALARPFLVTKYGKGGFRIYSYIRAESGKNVVIGVDIKQLNKGKGRPMLEINSIKTAFEHNGKVSPNEEIVGWDKDITPKEQALLEGLNYLTYPTLQELSTANLRYKNTDVKGSGDKKSENEAIRQAAERMAERLNTTMTMVGSVE
ncbi:MAG: hypothetical protein LIO91_01750, partial [Bacteroidales bacterium]|nr:hypothetical protein [Bacteroidales bacterium]